MYGVEEVERDTDDVLPACLLHYRHLGENVWGGRKLANSVIQKVPCQSVYSVVSVCQKKG